MTSTFFFGPVLNFLPVVASDFESSAVSDCEPMQRSLGVMERAEMGGWKIVRIAPGAVVSTTDASACV